MPVQNVGSITSNPNLAYLNNIDGSKLNLDESIYNQGGFNVPLAQDTVSLSGKENADIKHKDKKSGNGLLTVALLAGAFVAGKNYSKIAGFVKKYLGKETKNVVNSANKKLQKAKNKVADVGTQVSKKKRIKGTSVTGANSPITNQREAEIVQNINVSNANGNTRTIVEKAQKDVVTPEMQRAYDKSIAYQAPTKGQRNAMNQIHSRNAAQRAELNSVGNSAKGGEKLAEVKTVLEKAVPFKEGANMAKTGEIVSVRNGKVISIRKPDGNLISDELKIAKYMHKHNVSA